MTFDINMLDDSALWVATSFVIFITLVYGPFKKLIIDNLDKKILELKSELENSKKLKDEANKLFQDHLIKQKENKEKVEKIRLSAVNESKKIKDKIEIEIENALTRKNLNYEQLSIQMESKIREDIKNEILNKTLLYTEFRIKKNLKKEHNSKLIDESLKKLTNHLS